MISPENILADLRPLLAGLENKRHALLAKRSQGMLWITGLVLGGLLLALLLSSQGGIAPFLAFVGAGVGCLICYSLFFGTTEKDFQHAFKSEVVATIAKKLAPDIVFHPHQMVTRSWFERSKLFRRPDRYQGEDYFVGRVGKTDLFFSEIHAEEKHTSTDSKGHTSTHYTTIFKGIFLIADFHKEFRSEVTVTPDRLESFGFLGRKLQALGGRVERMENVAFEEHFVVRASDAVEARYLLTPAMQERFLKLSRTWSPELRASFRDSLLFLALPLKGNWFQGDIKKPVDDPHQFRTLVAQIHGCLRVVEDLDLNTRIWTKQ